MTNINFKLAIRNLKKDRVYSMLNIVGFTTGFAVFLIIALFILQEKTVDRSFANHRNIYRLIDAEKNKCNLNYDFSAAITANFPEVRFSSPMYLISGSDIPLESGDKAVSFKNLATTTNAFFDIFSIKTIKKQSNKPFADLNSAVITESLAKRLFPDGDPLGKELNIFDRFRPIVSAVVEDFPPNTSMEASLFLNMENEKFRFSRYCLNDNCTYLAIHFMLLQDHLDIAQFTQKLNQYFSVSGGKVKEVALQKLTDIYYAHGIEGNRNRTGNNTLILIFSAIASLILILSIINQLNFNLSLQLSKIKSIGIRKINGADRRHLSAYYLTEVSISIAFSMVLALGLVFLLLPNANQLLDTSLNLHLLYSPPFLIIIFTIIGFVILLNSLAPLNLLLKFNIPGFLSGNTTGGRRILQRKMLTVFQFAASIVLIISILIMSKQVHFVKNSDLGFGAEQLLKMDFPRGFKQQTAFQQKVNELAFVQSSSLSNGVPGNISRILDDGEKFQIKEMAVDRNFLKTFDIHLVDGRNFLAGDADKAFLFNEAAFQNAEWDEKAKNKFQGKEIIGTITDFHVSSFHSGMEPVCLLLSNNLTENISIRLTAGNISKKLTMLREIWAAFIPDKPMNYIFYDSWFDSLYRKEETLIKAIGTFGIISLIITCMGLFGQIYQESVSRTKEIGIRKINGAKVSEVIVLLNKDFVKWVVIAFVIATPVAWYAMSKWLESFAYKTTLSWWIFALAGLLALSIALFTVSFQSWKVATKNPVEALRYE